MTDIKPKHELTHEQRDSVLRMMGMQLNKYAIGECYSVKIGDETISSSKEDVEICSHQDFANLITRITKAKRDFNCGIDSDGITEVKFEHPRTPGTWSVGKNEMTVISSPPSLDHRFSDEKNVKYFGGTLIAESIARIEDAHLISAAPEMYEALQNLENDDHSIPEHAWKLVKDALAKAEGE